MTQAGAMKLSTGTVSTGGGVTLTSAMASTGSFTAPASGSVLVTARVMIKVSAGGSGVAFGLAAHGTVTPMIGYAVIPGPASAGPSAPAVLTFLVTGLVAGNSYNFDLLWCVASTVTATMYVFAQSTTTPALAEGAGVGQPVIVTVQAV